MEFNKDLWKDFTFRDNAFPELQCPKCNNGKLQFIKEKFIKIETGESKRDRDHEDWEPYWLRYKYTMVLICNYNKCSEVITSIGDGTVKQDMFEDRHGNWEEVYEEIYSPNYFWPALSIIDVKNVYPDGLSKQLSASFAHFFSDLTSCANKIRGCVEILIDTLGVKKTKMSGGKRLNLSLHARILLYKATNPTVADHLLAIKWIGNFGSHLSDLNKEDVLDAYQLLHYSLSKIYNSDAAMLRLTKEINKRKGPRSKKKS